MKITFRTFLHSDLSDQDIHAIIGLKQQAWPYDYESQIAWIKNNLQPSDVHCLLELDGKEIAYLNLVHIDVEMDQQKQGMLGIGNVCVALEHKGKGFGILLLNLTQLYISNNNLCAALLCHDHLVDFYKRCGAWKLVDSSIPKEVEGSKFEHNFMLFHCETMPKEYVNVNRNF